MSSSVFAFGLPILLGLIVLGISIFRNREFWPSCINGLITTVVSIVCVMMVLIIPTGERESVETYPLTTVGTGTQVEGHQSFLIGGTMESSPSYRFIMEVPAEAGFGVYKEGVEVKVSDVRVFEVDGEEPTVTVNTTTTTNLFGDTMRTSQKYEVRVPEGSIVESTDIDFSK